MRTDSLQDLSYGGGDRFASLPKQFTAPFDFRHRGVSEDLAKELIFGKDGTLPNKPSGPFSLGRLICIALIPEHLNGLHFTDTLLSKPVHQTVRVL